MRAKAQKHGKMVCESFRRTWELDAVEVLSWRRRDGCDGGKDAESKCERGVELHHRLIGEAEGGESRQRSGPVDLGL